MYNITTHEHKIIFIGYSFIYHSLISVFCYLKKILDSTNIYFNLIDYPALMKAEILKIPR